MMTHVCTPHAVYINPYVTVHVPYGELLVVCQAKLIKR